MYAYIYIHKYTSSKHLDKFIVTPGRVQTEMVKQPMAWKLVSSWDDLCNQDTVNYSVDPFSHNKRLGAKKNQRSVSPQRSLTLQRLFSYYGKAPLCFCRYDPPATALCSPMKKAAIIHCLRGQF